MSQQILRDYQQKAVHAILDAIDDGYTRILYTQATGTGKTTVFAELTRILLEYHGFNVLVLAHRRELIEQAYKRISDHCGLDEYEIGYEIAEWKASASNRVVVGSVMTVKNPGRLPDWKPNVIITDEAHRAAAKSYERIYERFGVADGSCLHIGCTATAKRTDRQSLYAIKPDGTSVQLVDKKTKKQFPADPHTSVYEFHCYEYSILQGVEEGYLVEPKGHTVETQTDLSDVETDADGDFKEGPLQKAVDNAERTLLAISAWKQVAQERPTLVFCAGVEHAHHSADLWQQAGYSAAALDGETDEVTRHRTLDAFRRGELQVLCNMGLFTEGTDLPTCSCIVHLRPTKSWNLYVQMTGRGTRVLPGVIDGIEEAQERCQAISASAKPDCLVIDLVDISEDKDPCTLPNILDLPVSLDLQGQSVVAAKRLLDEFEEVKERVIGENPTTYQELEVRLKQVNLLRDSRAKSKEDWSVMDGGFRFRRSPVGYQTELLSAGPNEWELHVKHYRDGELLRKKGKSGFDFEQYLDKAVSRANRLMEEHRLSQSRGTLALLTPKQKGCLRANGHSDQEIDCMPVGYARKLIGQYMQAWNSKHQSLSEDSSEEAA